MVYGIKQYKNENAKTTSRGKKQSTYWISNFTLFTTMQLASLFQFKCAIVYMCVCLCVCVSVFLAVHCFVLILTMV